MTTTPIQINNNKNISVLNSLNSSHNKLSNNFNNYLNITLEENIALQDEIKSKENQINFELSKRKEKLNILKNNLKDLKQFKINLKLELQDEEYKFKNLINNKEINYDKLSSNGVDLINEINKIKIILENNKSNYDKIIKKKIEKYDNKLVEKINRIKTIKKEIRNLNLILSQNNEKNQMLNEEIFISKIEIINLTSKMESVIEYIDDDTNNNSYYKSNNDFEMNLIEFKCINKEKLSKYLFNKLFNNLFNKVSEINNKNFNLNIIQICNNIKTKTLNEYIIKLKNEISLYINNNDLNLENLIKSYVKLLFYEYKSEIRIKFINENKVEKENLNIFNLEHKIKILNNKYYRKKQILKSLSNKRKELENEKLIKLKEEENLTIIIIEIENDINNIKNMQEAIRNESMILYEELEIIKNEFSYEFINIKNKKQELISQVKKQKQKIEYIIEQFNFEIEDTKRKILINNSELKNVINYNKSNIDLSMNNFSKENSMCVTNKKLNFDELLNSNNLRNLNNNKNSNHLNQNLSFEEHSNNIIDKFSSFNKLSTNNINQKSLTKKYLLIKKEVHEEDVKYIEQTLTKRIEKINSYYNTNNFKNLNNYKTQTLIAEKENDKNNILKENFLKDNNIMVNNNKERSLNLNFNPIIRNNNFIKNTNQKKLEKLENLNYSSKSITKSDVLLFEKLKFLQQTCHIYKRNNIINKKYPEYCPIDYNNKKENIPEDFNFKKYLISIDKNYNKLIFKKISSNITKQENKSTELNLSSISKLIVPNITKDIIFIKQIYKKYNKKTINIRNEEGSLNKFIENNIEKLYSKYNENNKEDKTGACDTNDRKNNNFNDKIFIEDYRKLMLESKNFILYFYIKIFKNTKSLNSCTESRVELIFTEYEDLKHWINGIEILLKKEDTIDFIRQKLI